MKVLLYLPFVVLLFACGDAEKEEDRFEELFKGELKIVDLTHSLGADSPAWPDPSGSRFTYDTLVAQPSGAPAMGKYNTPEHFGTHMDAPVHFTDNQASVDELAPNSLFGPAVVIDVRNQCASNANYALSVDDILQWENENGPIPDRAIVMMLTGWGDKWGDAAAYKNEDGKGKMHFPGFSPEAAKLLVTERNILGIGIDDFSVDPAMAEDFPVHLVVSAAGKFHLENVANLHELPATGAYLINAPIKLEGGSGGQVRIFAIVP